MNIFEQTIKDWTAKILITEYKFDKEGVCKRIRNELYENGSAVHYAAGGGGGAGENNSQPGGAGGSGIVVIRYATTEFQNEEGNNMTLVSTSNTASSAPTKGDLVALIENHRQTATLNTDIKGYVSRDGGTTWSQGTFVDEGDWGTNKKIISFHNLDISGQPSGTSVKWKIETLNQRTRSSRNTRIQY